MKNTTLYCNGCPYLIPQEEDQQEYEEHVCLLFENVRLVHNGMHPMIPRLRRCVDLDHMSLLIPDDRLEAYAQYFVGLCILENRGIHFVDFVLKHEYMARLGR